LTHFSYDVPAKDQVASNAFDWRSCVYSRNSGTRDSGVGVSFSPAISEKTYLGIPSALVSPLVETYFAHAYNASLLLHRPTFTDDLAAEVVRPDILLSVFAFAAK
jgi:hypothetical protein